MIQRLLLCSLAIVIALSAITTESQAGFAVFDYPGYSGFKYVTVTAPCPTDTFKNYTPGYNSAQAEMKVQFREMFGPSRTFHWNIIATNKSEGVIQLEGAHTVRSVST
jgi:hypothetical protein